MRWEVEGADKNTGQDKTIVVEADDPEAASRLANRRGLMVAAVRSLPTVKALIVRSPYAQQIASGKKRIEYRVWRTRYRGWLAIVAARRKESGPDAGRAVCLVRITDCVEHGPKDFHWKLGQSDPAGRAGGNSGPSWSVRCHGFVAGVGAGAGNGAIVATDGACNMVGPLKRTGERPPSCLPA
jgi:ASCH domain